MTSIHSQLKASNYPAGVTDAHPYFNPPTCPACGEGAEPGENCPGCGAYQPTNEDIEYEKADRLLSDPDYRR